MTAIVMTVDGHAVGKGYPLWDPTRYYVSVDSDDVLTFVDVASAEEYLRDSGAPSHWTVVEVGA